VPRPCLGNGNIRWGSACPGLPRLRSEAESFHEEPITNRIH